MTEIKGVIDSVENGVISGWIVTEDPSNITLYCGDFYLGNIDELLHRQDIIDAGYAEGNTGFRFDAKEFLDELSGFQLFSIKVDNHIIEKKEIYLQNNTNLVLNPFMVLANSFKLENISFNVNHRIGMSLNSFVAPKGLSHSNGYYTRIGFGDSHNTKSLLEFNFDLSLDLSDVNSPNPLELGLVAKSSHVCNLHMRLLDHTGTCVLDEPILINSTWSLSKQQISLENSNKIRSGELHLTIRAKHHGRRDIDISMVALSESVDDFKTPVQQKLIDSNNAETETQSNLLNNGHLGDWSNGIDFSLLKRGQELADNWFIEMNQANQGKVNILVAADNAGEDPLSQNLKTKFGLRARTKDLNGYARLICPFNTSLLGTLNYQLKIEVDTASLQKKAVLPRVYFIARNAYDDKIVMDVTRKAAITGRATLSFDLTAYQINKLIQEASNMPVLALAIDLESFSDLTIYSADLSVSEQEAEKKVEAVEFNNKDLEFEDKTITQQLHLLKGLDSWSKGEEISLEGCKEDNAELVNYTETSKNSFMHYILKLIPHKMHRPVRSFPLIDVIIPVYNACDDVLLCLSSLIEKTDLVHRIIIINDGQDKHTAEMLDSFNTSYSHIEVLTNSANIGYTKSVNRGIKNSNAEWVVVLNSDTIVSEGWLGNLMNCALSSNNVGMVGPLSNAASWQSVPEIHDENGDWHLNPLPTNLSIDEFSKLVKNHSLRTYPEVGVINGFCQLINMELLDQIGLLDEIAFPVGYGEENDMCARAVKAGFKLLVADDTYVFHSKSKSFGHEQRKKLAKQGSIALKKKHPDVDWGQVTALFRDNSALNELRGQLTLELNKILNGDI